MANVSRRIVHLITPGDHFSPSTGSAVPTIVHGLCSAAPTHPRAQVLVARGTYPDRHDSADVIEYDAAAPTRLPAKLDPVFGRLGLPRPLARRSFAAALAAQRDWDPAVIVAHNAPHAIRLIEPPHRAVLYAHNQLLRSYSHREAQRALAGVDRIVCVSAHLAEDTSRRLPPALRARVRVVPNGVDPGEFRGPRSPRAERLRIAYVGRVIPDKGVHVLLDAVKLLPGDAVQVQVIGRAGFSASDPLTPYERQLRASAAQLACPVEFASFVTRAELPSLLRSADVLVVPSVWPEPFGLTALEGMAAGCAVVASTAGGLPEAVGDAALTAPPGDARKLADAIDALRVDDDLLARHQRAGLERAAEMSWARILPTFLAAIHSSA